MVTRLFSSKSSSGSGRSGDKTSTLSQQVPPPPPPASHKPKSPYTPLVSKPPRRRPTNLPLLQPNSQPQHGESKLTPSPSHKTEHPPPYSSKTPPASTFRNTHQPHPLHFPRHQTHQQISPRGGPVNPQVANRLPNSQASTSQHSQHSFNQPNPTDNGGPTYGYLDLTRARSDESLLWTAEEEASALVAELRASLNCNNTNSDNSINCVGRHSVVYFAGDDSSSAGHRGLNPYHHAKPGYPNGLPALNSHQRHDNESAFRNPASSVIQGGSVLSEQDPDRPSVSGGIHPAMGVRLPNPFQRSFSVHKRSSEARAAAQKLNHSPPLRSHSFTDLQSAVELMPLQNGSSHCGRPSPVGGSSLGGSSGLGGSGSLGDSGAPDPRHGLGCGLPLKTFGGSWKSLLRVGAMSGRSSGKPPGAGIKKVAPPTVPGHHHMQHLQHHSSSSHSDPSTPSHTPTQTPTHVPNSHTMQHHLTIAPGPPSAAPDTPTSSTGSASNYRHSGSSFHSSSTASSGVFSGADQRASFSSSIGSSEDAVSTHSSNPPPSPCSPSSGSSSLDSGARGPTGRLSCATTGGASPSHCPSAASGGQQFAFPPPPSGTHVGAPQFAHLLCKSQPPPHSPHHQPPPPHGAEDQGIDVASPVRSGSPGSGSSSGGSSAGCCRHSTTSLDSGRASATTHHHHHHHHHTHPHHQHRLSGQSYDSGGGGAGSSGSGSLRHSYHSSSSSLGSIESPHLNVADLLNNGVRDCEVLRAWLTELHLEEHTDQFMNAGYDMPTISRMTPEDLNAIGVTKPAHRKKLKTEITRLNISDGLPDYIPATLEEWLVALRLSEYHATLQRQGYCSPLQMLQVMWEDLEEMGITRLGHQKKVMLAIKRIKDIKGGKKFSSTLPPQPPPPQEIVSITRDCPGETYSGLADLRTFAGQRAAQSDCYPPRAPPSEAYAVHRSASESYASSYNCNSGPSAMTVGAYNPNGAQFSPSVYRSYTAAHHGVVPGSPLHRQNSQHGSHSSSNNNANNIISSNKLQHHSQYAGHGGQPGSNSHPAIQYRPDFVTVQVHPQVRRNKDGVFEEPIYTTFHPENNRFSQQYPQQHPQQLHLQQQQSNQFSSLPPRPSLPSMGNSYPPRSLDDGDITPTNEITSYEGGGTLPRHRASGNKFRPVAKVTAKTRVEVHQEMNQNEKSSLPNAPEYIKDHEKCVVDGGLSNGCLKQTENIVNANKVENIYNMIHAHSTNNTPQGTPKKLPPPPPRRSNSISETSKVDSLNNSNNLKHGIHNTLPSSHPNSLSTSGQGGGSTNSTVTAAAATPSRESQYGFLRRGLNYGYMGVKNNLQPDIASDLPPPPPAPNDVGNHQHILHHHSHRRPQQQMLPASPEHQCEAGHAASVKTSGNQREGSGNGKTSHQAGAKEEDDFPPPPPPLAASGASTGGKEGVGNCVGELDGAVITRPRRNDSTVSNCSHKSTSSTDSSDSLPFANDNAGTIKQRYTTSGSAPPLPSLPPHLHASPLSSPHASPSALRRTGPLRTSLHKGGPCSTPVRSGAVNSRRARGVEIGGSARSEGTPYPNPPWRGSLPRLASGGLGIYIRRAGSASRFLPPAFDEATPPLDRSHPQSGRRFDETNTDVLSDIGNMLANLTDELDAMLEQEMVT